MKLKMLVKRFSKISLILIFSSCNKMPLVTINQLDTIHGVANPFKITKYNEDTCKLEVQEEKPFPIMGTQLHGAFCVTADDFAKIKAKAKADCENNKPKNQ